MCWLNLPMLVILVLLSTLHSKFIYLIQVKAYFTRMIIDPPMLVLDLSLM